MNKETYILLYGLTVLACINFVLVAFSPSTRERQPGFLPTWEETYTTGDFDRLQVWRLYQLGPGDDPSRIPTGDFERNGRTYRLLYEAKEDSGDFTLFTVVFYETEVEEAA